MDLLMVTAEQCVLISLTFASIFNLLITLDHCSLSKHKQSCEHSFGTLFICCGNIWPSILRSWRSRRGKCSRFSIHDHETWTEPGVILVGEVSHASTDTYVHLLNTVLSLYPQYPHQEIVGGSWPEFLPQLARLLWSSRRPIWVRLFPTESHLAPLNPLFG